MLPTRMFPVPFIGDHELYWITCQTTSCPDLSWGRPRYSCPARPDFKNEKNFWIGCSLFADGKIPLVGNGFVHSRTKRTLSKVHAWKCTIESARWKVHAKLHDIEWWGKYKERMVMYPLTYQSYLSHLGVRKSQNCHMRRLWQLRRWWQKW